MPVTAVVGGHWGDEGKGKVINLLARDADLVIRGHGGANAGHTVVNEQGRFAVHLIPAGIFNPRALCVIGPGVAVHPGLLVAELDELGAREIDTAGLRVSTAAHLVMPYHQSLDRAEDEAREERRLGTTGRGIGPTYVDKARRVGLRVGDLLNPAQFREK
ncbi:MAG TPA: adenylosuccinate synthetase, partial [Chloroflexota bacterium]